MSKKLRLILALGLGLAMTADSHAQGGWTQPAGGMFVKVDWSYLNASEYAMPDGERIETEAFTQHNINLYSEFGLSPRLTLLVQGPLLRSQRFATTTTATGLGDLRMDLKYRLTSDYLPVAVSIGAEMPTGDPARTVEVNGIPGLEQPLPTGDGEWNVWTTAAASRGWRKTYVSAFAAANWRTSNADFDFVNLYQAGVEFGFRPADPLWLNLKLRAQFREGPGEVPEPYFLYGDATTYTITALEAYFAFHPQWGATLTFLSGGDLISKLRNIYLAPVIALGVVYRRTPDPTRP
jgi:hypothetical protein